MVEIIEAAKLRFLDSFLLKITLRPFKQTCLFMLFQLHLANSKDKSVMSFDIGSSIQVRFTMLAGALFDVTSGSRV